MAPARSGRLDGPVDPTDYVLTPTEFGFMLLGDFFGLMFVFYLMFFIFERAGPCRRKVKLVREKSSSIVIDPIRRYSSRLSTKSESNKNLTDGEGGGTNTASGRRASMAPQSRRSSASSSTSTSSSTTESSREGIWIKDVERGDEENGNSHQSRSEYHGQKRVSFDQAAMQGALMERAGRDLRELRDRLAAVDSETSDDDDGGLRLGLDSRRLSMKLEAVQEASEMGSIASA